MGNHRMEHHRSRTNTTSPIMSEATIVETRKQPARIGVIQSLNAGITTMGVENGCYTQHGCCQKGSSNWICSIIG
jgi:hypothetical protein